MSETIVSPVLEENVDLGEEPDFLVVGPSRTKSHMMENSTLESESFFKKKEITSEIKGMLIQSQKEVLKLLKPKTRENENEETEATSEVNPRNFHTLTKSVRFKSLLNNDPDLSCGRMFGLALMG